MPSRRSASFQKIDATDAILYPCGTCGHAQSQHRRHAYPVSQEPPPVCACGCRAYTPSACKKRNPEEILLEEIFGKPWMHSEEEAVAHFLAVVDSQPADRTLKEVVEYISHGAVVRAWQGDHADDKRRCVVECLEAAIDLMSDIRFEMLAKTKETANAR